MKPVKKAVKKAFAIAMVFSVMLTAGIPMIVLGAVNGIWAVMGLGIAFLVLGFFGTPVAWSKFGDTRRSARVVSAIVEECIYSVKDIASHLSLSERAVSGILTDCFRRKYLLGYRRDGDEIFINESVRDRELSYECPYCGAKFTYTAENARCSYCNSPVMPEPRT